MDTKNNTTTLPTVAKVYVATCKNRSIDINGIGGDISIVWETPPDPTGFVLCAYCQNSNPFFF